jgi:hypothetical protein
VLSFNVVWQSQAPSPKVDIFWKPEYGISWTAKIFADGVTVALGGAWQPAKLGQIFDIDKNGEFQASTKPPVQDYIAIGTNYYKNTQTPLGIRVVVGVKDGDDYKPIFVDPTAIGINMSATFQPQEKVLWWYAAGSKSSTMFTTHSGPSSEGDFSSPDNVTRNFRKTSAYDWDNGVWNTSALS